MAERIIPKEDLKKIEVVSGGSLFLTGWNRDEIRIKELSDQDEVEKKKTQLNLVFANDAIIHVPHSLEIVIEAVGGDGSIQGIRGKLEISTIRGDLSLIDIDSAKIGSVGGDLIANRVQGDLLIENTGGDALVNNIQGQISLQQVGGDVHLDKVGGGIEVITGGEASLSFHPVPWQAYQVKAGGDISVSIPDESSADLSIHSAKEDITVIIGDIDQKLKEKDFSRQLGEGGPAIMLSAGGKAFLTRDDFTWLTNIKINADELENLAVDFSAEAAEQIRNQLERLEEGLRESLSGLSESLDSMGISEEDLQKIASQIEAGSRKAIHKAEIAAIKAQAKVEKKIAQVRKKALKFKSKTKGFDVNEFLAKQEQKRTVSEDERMLILEMLQNKKISPEEADDLLQALEGKKKR